jgi:hypothetical protein
MILYDCRCDGRLKQREEKKKRGRKKKKREWVFELRKLRIIIVSAFEASQSTALTFFYWAANRHIHSENKNDGVATVKREKVAAGEGVQVCLQEAFTPNNRSLCTVLPSF